MNLGSASTQRATSTETKGPSEAGTRLSGRWLLIARMGWIALVAFTLSVSGASLPLYMAQLRTVSGEGVYIPWQLFPDNAQALQHLGISLDVYAAWATALSAAPALVWVAVGGVLFWRKSDDWIALLVALSLFLWGAGFTRGLLDPSGLTWLCLNLLSGTAMYLVFSLFPSGRFAPRWIGWFLLVAIPLTGGGQNFFPDSPLNTQNWPAPLGDVFFVGVIGSLIGAQIYRYRCVSTLVQRQQTKWVVFALTVTILGFAGHIVVVDVLPHFFPALSPSDLLIQVESILGGNFLPVLIPLSFGIAIFRHRLWDIDIVINRTLVYGVLTASVVGLYILVVVSLGTLFQAQGNLVISLLATGLIAVLFQPLRSRLQRLVNRLLFGERDEPYRVISHLGQRLEATLAPEEVPQAIVETVARSLKLPYVALSLKQDDAFKIVAFHGTAGANLLRLPLTYHADTIGELILATRTGSELFTRNERQLLNELARQAGIAVHSVLLTVDLERSRQRIVAAREEARRRLGSDLHDGLGHILAGVLRKVESSSLLLERDPPAAQNVLTDIKQQTKSAIDSIRLLAHTLHPPELELLGLVQALSERIHQYDQPNGSAVHVRLDVPPTLPPLPIAVEAAAYYIALETVNNVYQHAHARNCSLRLRFLDDDENAHLLLGVWCTALLELEICDDGCGLPTAIDFQKKHTGLGLASIHERATELGGTCLIEGAAQGGTRVYVRLPIMQIHDTGGK